MGWLDRLIFLDERPASREPVFIGYRDGKPLYRRQDGSLYVVERAAFYQDDEHPSGDPLFYGRVQRNVR
jgi:hypothetical protein